MGGLAGKYSIVGIGDGEYVRGSGLSTGAMAVTAIRDACADAGLELSDVDGLMSWNWADSTFSVQVAGDLGIAPSYHMDVYGGGSTPEAMVGMAMGAIEAGLCETVVIWRSMNGYSGVRPGGTGDYAAAPISAEELWSRPFGVHSAGESFAQYYSRFMYEYGIGPEVAAQIKVQASLAASNNPKALKKKRLSIEDVLSSRMICAPSHLLDCCLETDNAGALVVTSAERAKDLRQKPVTIQGVAARVSGESPRYHGDLTTFAGERAAERVFGMAGVGPEDIDLTQSYDCFTWTSLIQLAAYGFCAPSELPEYATPGVIGLAGSRPNNTSGGQLCEGYANGLNLVIENVRQLRGTADDYCPGAADGHHSFDYAEGECRQVRKADLAINMGFNDPTLASALILGSGR